MNLIYPKLRLNLLPRILGYAVLGALLSGLYGIIHDQFTFSISNEYFTRLKFVQFEYANFGLPPRVFVAEIGFLASWWVGFFAGWFLARLAVPALPREKTFHHCFRGMIIVLGTALAGSLLGYLFGLRPGVELSGWQEIGSTLGIVDLSGFVRVAYIHNATYLGGFVGLIAAIVYLQRVKNAQPQRGTI